MQVQNVFSGGRFEIVGSYARGKRVGPFVFVSGTTAIDDSGQLVAPGDCYAQSVFILAKIEKILNSMGAEMRHVVRTLAFLADMKSGVGDFVKAHGEAFKDINPVSTGVEAGLTRPGMMVEIQVDAIVYDADDPLPKSVLKTQPSSKPPRKPAARKAGSKRQTPKARGAKTKR